MTQFPKIESTNQSALFSATLLCEFTLFAFSLCLLRMGTSALTNSEGWLRLLMKFIATAVYFVHETVDMNKVHFVGVAFTVKP